MVTAVHIDHQKYWSLPPEGCTVASTTEEPPLGEVWMLVRDRKMLATLMAIHRISQRKLSRVAGWKSHTYLLRILRGDIKTIAPEPALRIAAHFGVPVDSLFLTRVTSNSGEVNQKVPA
jgi:hypothetical protein